MQCPALCALLYGVRLADDKFTSSHRIGCPLQITRNMVRAVTTPHANNNMSGRGNAPQLRSVDSSQLVTNQITSAALYPSPLL